MDVKQGLQPGIMIVDDDDIDIRVIRRALKKRGIDKVPLIAHDGVEALEMLRANSGGDGAAPWILLVDINMPRLNGHEFIEELRTDDDLGDSIVFMLTTSDRDQDKQRAYAQNVAGYIVKSDAGPNFTDLTDKLRGFLSRGQFRQQDNGVRHER